MEIVTKFPWIWPTFFQKLKWGTLASRWHSLKFSFFIFFCFVLCMFYLSNELRSSDFTRSPGHQVGTLEMKMNEWRVTLLSNDFKRNCRAYNLFNNHLTSRVAGSGLLQKTFPHYQDFYKAYPRAGKRPKLIRQRNIM